ncbi:MAG TPA: PocR ligand-binding domain-containing protein, partial [Pyrinomonadaceae bacterium]|nr:PocR ligand-binding domain-containing protein [Pyrinomonadaceae bacterium]
MNLKTMDEPVVPVGDKGKAQNNQVPGDWPAAQDSLAAASGLSILLVEGHQPPALAVSNNNSICHAFQSSPKHVHLCDPYCGVAYERAIKAGETTHYRCHAGLHCIAMPVNLGTGRQLAVIAGRAFLTSADYRALAERFRVGDLQELLSTEIFRNLIFASREDLGDLARRIEDAARELSGEKRVSEREEMQTAVSESETRKKIETATPVSKIEPEKRVV